MKDNIYIIGAATTPFRKWPDKSVKMLATEVVADALRDAGLNADQIEAAWFSNTRQPMLEGQNTIRGQIALGAAGLPSVPIFNIENACASGSSAVFNAANHIRAGQADIVMAVGVEKMFFTDRREKMFAAFMGGTDIELIDETAERMSAIGRDIIPENADNSTERSFFMDVYAAMARQHMKTFGTTQEHLAAAAAKAHFHSTLNPKSQYQKDMSIEEVLADKQIVWPFTRAMCAPISDGGAAVILARGSALTDDQRKRAVEIKGVGIASAQKREMTDYARHAGRRAATIAYEQAGVDPADIDVVELHDASAFAEIQQIENLQLCPMGEGGAFTASGATKLGGSVVVNPCGGLMSKGHPVGATGIAQLEELVLQLRGEAGARQVEGARLGVAENGGGFLHVEEAVTVVTVLSR